MNSFDLALLRILAKCAEQNRVKSYNDVTGSVAKPDNNKCPCDMACEGELGTACYMCNAGTVSAGLFPLLYNSCWCQSRSEIPWSSAPEHHTQPGNKALVWLPRLPCSCFTGWNETPCRVRITGRERATLRDSNTLQGKEIWIWCQSKSAFSFLMHQIPLLNLHDRVICVAWIARLTFAAGKSPH